MQMLRLRPVLAILMLLAPMAFAAGLTDGPTTRYMVGYAPEDRDAAHLAIQAAGGEITRTSPELSFAVVQSSNEDFMSLVSMSPSIRYVEYDDVTRMTGTQWNGVQWNGVQWNGVQWNGVQWNGVQWNANEWNGQQWNDANLKDVSEGQRLAAKWTEKQFQAESTNKMKWAGENTDPGLVWHWGAWAADANYAWINGKTGTRTASVCVLDSGVAWDHPDIQGNYEAGHNAIDPGRSAYDDGGHGTHVAGVAAAVLGDAHGVSGVGNVKILNAKVLAANGEGYESDLAFGLVWCAQQDAEVALMALSVTERDHPTLRRALQYATDRDVLLVASAGNKGVCDDCVSFPGSDPRVVAVGAVDGNLDLAAFSSRGSQVELAAPGVAILSTLPGPSYGIGDGTSQAAAFAAGSAALVRDLAPGLTAGETRQVLSATARELGPAGRDVAYGHGLVQVDDALAAAQAAP